MKISKATEVKAPASVGGPELVAQILNGAKAELAKLGLTPEEINLAVEAIGQRAMARIELLKMPPSEREGFVAHLTERGKGAVLMAALTARANQRDGFGPPLNIPAIHSLVVSAGDRCGNIMEQAYKLSNATAQLAKDVLNNIR